jgi:hypothetical protein
MRAQMNKSHKRILTPLIFYGKEKLENIPELKIASLCVFSTV